MEFLIIPRRGGTERFEDDVRFDAFGRGRILEDIKSKAERRQITLKGEEPEAGYWTEKKSIYAHEFTDGAKPVWIWWAE